MTTTSTRLQLKDVSASYDRATLVLRDLSLDIAAGELVALLGPSGCGKTTALKIVAGLLRPTSGDVLFDGQLFTRVPAERRGAVMVFQKPLLFPYLTVAENVAFGLKMRRTPKPEVARRVGEALRLVQLEGYDARRPKELSGGQEQRVALARALVTEPRVLLLDEPFSALDVGLRAEMRSLVRSLQSRLRITTVFVTHDQEEAGTIADRIALLLDGRLEQFSAPRDFYTAPSTPEAARFFGWKVIEGAQRGCQVETPLGSFALPESDASAGSDRRAMIAFHPASARLVARNGDSPTSVENNLAGRLETVVDLGTRIRYTVALPSGELIEIDRALHDDRGPAPPMKSGTQVFVHVPAEAVKVFLPDSDETEVRGQRSEIS